MTQTEIGTRFCDHLLDCSFGIPAELRKHIHYGNPDNCSNEVQIVIVKNSDFDIENRHCNEMPGLPVGQLDGMPILFGEPRVQTNEYGQTIVYADLIASSYFLLTRSEEILRRDCRDLHGRFPGKESLPSRANFIQRPIVDEYGKWLRQLLRSKGLVVPESIGRFRLTLSHDVDHIQMFDSTIKAVRGTAKRIMRRNPDPLGPLLAYAGLQKDPLDTFDWISEQNNSAKQTLGNAEFDEIYFFMACDHGLHDGNYRIESNDARRLIAQLKRRGVKIGLHPSYAAGENPELIAKEKDRLEKVVEQPVTCSRNHYLRLREPEHYEGLINAGIKDDYTGGYADCPGFRLGTSRPWKYFDPIGRKPKDLTIHPLQIMDVSFESLQYLGMSVDDAIQFASVIVDNTIAHGGELVLLFHNNLFAESNGPYQREFYTRLLSLVAARCSEASPA